MSKPHKNQKNAKIIHLDKQLIECSQNGDLMRVKALFSLGADIHAGNDQALYESATQGHLNVVKYLLKNNADTNANKNTFKDTIKNGHLNILKQFVISGYRFRENKDDLLLLAAKAGHVAIVKYFLDLGADIHFANHSALILSAQNNNFVVIQYLLDNGASIQHSNLFNNPTIKKETKSLIAQWLIARDEAKRQEYESKGLYFETNLDFIPSDFSDDINTQLSTVTTVNQPVGKPEVTAITFSDDDLDFSKPFTFGSSLTT